MLPGRATCIVRETFAAFGTLALGLALCDIARGQIKAGVIVGTVSDHAGAAVPGAGVSVVNQETNVAPATVADEAERRGDFSQTYVSVGSQAVPILLYDPFSAARVGTTSVFNHTQIRPGLNLAFGATNLTTAPGQSHYKT